MKNKIFFTKNRERKKIRRRFFSVFDFRKGPPLAKKKVDFLYKNNDVLLEYFSHPFFRPKKTSPENDIFACVILKEPPFKIADFYLKKLIFPIFR